MRSRLLAPLMLAVLAVSGSPCAWAMSSFHDVKAGHHSSETLVLDRHGEVLHRLRTDTTVRSGQWVTLADTSPALRTALVLSEDKRFYEHSGVDWQAVTAAAWANLWNSKTRGASTITMQLAGLLDDDLKRNAGGRSVAQKLGQTVSAKLLEHGWRKDQILEAYLNLVPFRGELVGIDAMSQSLFGKAAHGLDEREAAVAAALVRAPNAKPAQVTQRACEVMKSLRVAGAMRPPSTPTVPPVSGSTSTAVDCEALDLFVSAALQRRDYKASEGLAPHLAQLLSRRNATPQARITSTVHAPLQRFALQTLQQQLRELRGRHVEDAALVVLDNASGEVLAWVGSSGVLSNAADVDGVTAMRQPGSTLKPFLYGQAIAERRLTAASLLEDSDTQIQTSGGLYIPQNYDHQFKGWVSARTALGASLNVPAVRTLVMVSPDSFAKQLVRLGLPLKESGDYYGYSLALGSAEVSLLNLSNAYRALANGGRASPVAYGLNEKPRWQPALDPRAAFIVSDMLSDTNARARTFGTDSILATRFWTAVKTGTSKDMRDNWAIGYSARYTVGVWVGNASGAPMWDVSGTTGAAPIWAAIMNHLHRTVPSRAPKAPTGIVQMPVQFATTPVHGVNALAPLEAPRTEWFVQGTQQNTFALVANTVQASNAKTVNSNLGPAAAGPGRIKAPTNGTIIALDPDIPPTRQRVNFQAEGEGLHWLLDGKVFAKGGSAQWLPWPGKHVVQIASAKGPILDEIRLEVRGAGLKDMPSAHSKPP